MRWCWCWCSYWCWCWCGVGGRCCRGSCCCVAVCSLARLRSCCPLPCLVLPYTVWRLSAVGAYVLVAVLKAIAIRVSYFCTFVAVLYCEYFTPWSMRMFLFSIFFGVCRRKRWISQSSTSWSPATPSRIASSTCSRYVDTAEVAHTFLFCFFVHRGACFKSVFFCHNGLD